MHICEPALFPLLLLGEGNFIIHLYVANISTEEMDKLQPYGHIMETDKTIGWATGLKACWQTRESLILLILYYSYLTIP